MSAGTKELLGDAVALGSGVIAWMNQSTHLMNETNNTDEDVRFNRLNGRIVVVPTRTIEFVAIDFIITTSGVQFV